MATVKTKYLGGLRTEMTHIQSNTKVMTDAPLDNHGKGEFFSPTDIMAASLASCMLTIMGISAKNHGFSIDGVEVETTKIMNADPRRIKEIIVTFCFPLDYTDSEKRIIEAAAKTCPAEKSLHPDIIRTVTFSYGKSCK